ncbi:outer membrane lipoprotein carrier protein LolA [bacterium]|nr:outer membrane lipoprotein carrier protein LolA [bacterium]
MVFFPGKRGNHSRWREAFSGLLVAALWPLAVTAWAQVLPTASERSMPPEPVEYADSLIRSDLPTSAVLSYLNRVEARHGKIKSLTAMFNQVRVSDDFGFETTSDDNRLYLEFPDKLRCDYAAPDPSTLLFVGRSIYQYVPSLEQVDKMTYPTAEQARRIFETLTLSFGVSAQTVLDGYQVELGEPQEAHKTFALIFHPLKKEVKQDYQKIEVRFDEETLLPVQVRLYQVMGDVTTLRIREGKRDVDIPEEIFKPSFPEGTEIFEH